MDMAIPKSRSLDPLTKVVSMERSGGKERDTKQTTLFCRGEQRNEEARGKASWPEGCNTPGGEGCPRGQEVRPEGTGQRGDRELTTSLPLSLFCLEEALPSQ